MNITLQQLATLDAVIKQGSIQAGASYLNKTHPSVISSLKKLEDEIGFLLFDRSGYRSTLTHKGETFYQNSQAILTDIHELEAYAQHLSDNKEAQLNIAIGDITPIPKALKKLHTFSNNNKLTRLNLLFENLGGATERLLEGDADLIIHPIDKSDTRYEYKDFCKVHIIPVVAHDYLSIPISNKLKYADLSKHTQCIIKSTAKENSENNYFISEHSPYITVGDQHTKKELIVQGMAWGHMPRFLIKKELKKGKLISIEGNYIKGHTIDVVVSRLHKKTHGIMAESLWQNF